jgi:hypothetical protein
MLTIAAIAEMTASMAAAGIPAVRRAMASRWSSDSIAG